MKILYIYKYAILGGVTTQLVNRLTYLKSHLECHILYIKDYGGTVAYQDKSNIIVEDDIKKIAVYIDQHQFDFVIVIDTVEAYDAIRQCSHKPIVISEVHTTTTNLYHLKELKKTLPMDAFITPSYYLKDRILNEFGYEGQKQCYVVENCLDMKKFNVMENSLKYSKKIIGWVGKLDEHKNWKKLLYVVKEVIREIPEAEVWVIGGYTAPEDVVQNFIIKQDEYNLLDHIKWYPYIEYDKMPRVYNMISYSEGCMLSTSQNESFGMSAVEAMACKCPVVMPRVGALPEVIDGMLSHNLYEYEEDSSAITNLINVLKNSNEKEIQYAYNKVMTYYDIKTVGEKYINTLLKIKNTI